MKLPCFISVPHCSLKIPDEIKEICILSQKDIIKDSDEQADGIYSYLQGHVIGFVRADVARAVVDLNRSPDDIGGDGLIKTETCYNTPVYKIFPDDQLISALLEKYYRPYHEKLKNGATLPGVKMGIDCHTMSDVGPPVGPDSGKKRPFICLSNAEYSCPLDWLLSLASELEDVFGEKIAVNTPFKGGYIIRHHAHEMPWLQLEFSRTRTLSPEQKGQGLLKALNQWVMKLE